MDMTGIYAKDINRTIDGVIKADESAHIRSEVDEYVMTSEIRAGLDRILDEWNALRPQSNGVWISGFFGSGKSHMLKMMSYLLGDVRGSGEMTRQQVAEVFTQKASGHEMLIAGIGHSQQIPALSMLFNIDAKDDKATSRPEAMIEVFYRAFFEARGLYTADLGVGALERDLVDRGLFDQFKECFRAVAGGEWEDRRAGTVFAEAPTARALAGVGIEVDKPIASYRASLNRSAEAFADEVARWLDSREPGARIGFFIDEVGQFIGRNTQLMLNLQTITEQLFTKCSGRAWVFVTSQEKLDDVIGGLGEQQGNDFSKIQGRFTTQINLSTQEVEQVIARRLLAKSDAGRTALEGQWSRSGAGFASMFTFPAWQKAYSNYADEEAFIAKYPFVDYQFDMFSQTMIGMSESGLFTGRHSSVGARSLLGVCQQIAQNLQERPIGTIASFDQFYDGIAAMLKSDVKENLHRAQANSLTSDRFTISVLKALLLARYVKDFPCAPSNLVVLLRRDLGQDATALEARIKRSLDALVGQYFVQKLPEGTYTYMTDEEKEVKQQIGRISVSEGEVTGHLMRSVRAVLGNAAASYRHPDTDLDLRITTIMDCMRPASTESLVLNCVTPLSQVDAEAARIRSTGGQDTLTVVLALSDETVEEVYMYLRTERYVRGATGSSAPSGRKRLIQTYGEQNNERDEGIKAAVRMSFKGARFFTDGSEVEVPASMPPAEAVNRGMGVVVGRVYHRMGDALPLAKLKEGDVDRFLRDEDEGLLPEGGLQAANPLADQFAQWVKQSRDLEGRSVFVRDAVDHFRAAPFGWGQNAVLAIVATAIRRGLVDAKLNERPLTRTELSSGLRVSQDRSRILLEPKRQVDQRALARFRAFAKEFVLSDGRLDDDNARAVAVDNAVQGWRAVLDRARRTPFDFGGEIDEAEAALEAVGAGPLGAEAYLAPCVQAVFDNVVEIRSDFLEPLQEFLTRHMPAVEDAVRAADSLAAYGDGVGEDGRRAIEELRALVSDEHLYNRTDEVAPLRERVERARRVFVDERRSEALRAFEGVRAEVTASDEFGQADPTAREAALSRIDAECASIRGMTDPGAIVIAAQRVDALSAELFARLIASRERVDEGHGHSDEAPGGRAAPPQVVQLSALARDLCRTTIRTPDDVDAYVEELRAALHRAVSNGDIIRR